MSRLQQARLARVEARLGGNPERQRLDAYVRRLFNPYEMPADELALLVELYRRCAWRWQTDAEHLAQWRAACAEDAERTLFDRALARVPPGPEHVARLVRAVSDGAL